jgi:tetratricopeptide (TPR) repeat protein
MQLEEVAEHAENIIYAQSNMMKAYYNKGDFSQAVSYAEKVLNHTSASAKVKSDAQIIIARSAIKNGNHDKARAAYQNVESIATGELKAEALYYNAYYKHVDGNYKNSNVVVQTIASDYAAYKYWGAKGLIIMAKNFYALQDSYQATYILKSVIKNFKQFDDVVQEAQLELNKIKKEEAKTNDSVLPEK